MVQRLILKIIRTKQRENFEVVTGFKRKEWVLSEKCKTRSQQVLRGATSNLMMDETDDLCAVSHSILNKWKIYFSH
jgi:spore coat polysaccharide biosynthesis protein SpsF (cytidylyltransferase family)